MVGGGPERWARAEDVRWEVEVGRSSLAWTVGNSAGRKIDLYLERPKLGSFATLIDEQWGSACGSSVASGRMVVCIGNSENREPLRTVIVNM